MRFLFVCIENSCRSQMAEAFARLHGGDDVEAYSAGSRASGTVNPRAIATMTEIGYDMEAHESKGLDQVPPGGYDYVITMGCGDVCPYVPTVAGEDWDIPDPKNMNTDEFREVRCLIETRVKELLDRASRR